jgi:hypothetical protein
MVLSDKDLEDFVSRIKTPKLERKIKASVLELASDRKLSVEGQRERVAKEVKELVTSERNAPRPDERATDFYYRQLYRAVACAEYWAKQLTPAGQYDLFGKDGV